MSGINVTYNLLRLCNVFIRNKPKKLSCYAVAKELTTDNSTAWATLKKLESEGWLKSEMERANPMVTRPRRRLYQMTPQGEQESRKLLSDLQLPCPG